MYDEAVAELQKAVQLSGGSPTCIANLARAYVASGSGAEAVEAAERSEEALKPRLFACLGDRHDLCISRR